MHEGSPKDGAGCLARSQGYLRMSANAVEPLDTVQGSESRLRGLMKASSGIRVWSIGGWSEKDGAGFLLGSQRYLRMSANAVEP